MKINKELMKKARLQKQQHKLIDYQRLRERVCLKHEFLLCKKPKLVYYTYYASSQGEYRHQGDLQYHECINCQKRVGDSE